MYGEGRQWRYVVGFGLIIVFLFVIIFLIVHSGGNNNKVPQTQRTLVSYADNDNVTVSETTVGPIVADQDHSQVRIDVSNRVSTVTLMQGYNGTVVNSKSYANNVASFREFLQALDKAGFTRGNTSQQLANDQGYCSGGNRYIYTITNGSDTIQRFWITSCGGTKTYDGNAAVTRSLFQAQIPDYGQVVSDANLGSTQLVL